MDAELAGLITAVAKATSGQAELSKHDCYVAMKRIARGLAKEGESNEKAFCRIFVDRHAPGASVFKAYQAAGPVAYIRKSSRPAAQGGDEDAAPEHRFGSGRSDADAPDFTALVDDHQKRNPTMSRSQSIDACMTTRPGRAAMALSKRHALTG